LFDPREDEDPPLDLSPLEQATEHPAMPDLQPSGTRPPGSPSPVPEPQPQPDTTVPEPGPQAKPAADANPIPSPKTVLKEPKAAAKPPVRYVPPIPPVPPVLSRALADLKAGRPIMGAIDPKLAPKPAHFLTRPAVPPKSPATKGMGEALPCDTADSIHAGSKDEEIESSRGNQECTIRSRPGSWAATP
jgi:hypothetical protein